MFHVKHSGLSILDFSDAVFLGQVPLIHRSENVSRETFKRRKRGVPQKVSRDQLHR